jgi:hypothetical protein
MKMNRFAALIGVAACSAGVANAQNVLQNAGFESACQSASGWIDFGNVDSINFYTTSGARSIKMYGTFCGTGPCYSGIYQDFPAAAGQQWKGSGNVFSPCWDRLRPAATGGTQAFVQIDFLDAGGVILNAPQAHISPIQTESTITGGNAACVDPAPEPLPVYLETAFATAPAGTASVRITLLVEQTQSVGGAAWWDDAGLVEQSSGVNVLTNSSFEDAPSGCTGSPLAYWTNFGNGQGNAGENTRNGNFAAKLFGGYNGNPAYSGWFQNVPAVAGSRWQASGWARSSLTDSLAVGNNVVLGIEFFDEFGTNLVGLQGGSNAVPTPGDDTYRFYQSGVAEAPAGTAFARCLILQVQTNFAAGATWWDDMEFVQIPLCGSADFDGDGDTGTDADIEAFFACLGGNCCVTCGTADFDQDGDTGTDADIEAFFRVLGGGNC